MEALGDLFASASSSMAMLSTTALVGGLALIFGTGIFTNSHGWDLIRAWYRGSEDFFGCVSISIFITPLIARLIHSRDLMAWSWGLHGMYWSMLAVSFLSGLTVGFGTIMFGTAAVFCWLGFANSLTQLEAQVE